MITTAEFVERARAKHGKRFDYACSKYVGFRKPIEVTCREHGPCMTTPKSHLHTDTGGCTTCLSRAIGAASRLTTDEFIERARKVHGDQYSYDQVHYEGTRTKVTIVCPKHGPFRMRAHRHLEGRGCRKCTFRKLGRQRRLSFWDFVERVVAVHGVGRYDYELRDHINQNSKIPIHCPEHGVFHQSVGSHLQGHGCPACIQSNGEQRVREVLSLLDLDFSEQVRFCRCRAKRALPFDFYLPDYRLLIEYDGRQHYESSDLWGGEEKLAETKRHGEIKDRFAAENGYCLLRIPYWEYDNVDAVVLDQLAKIEKEQCL